MFCVSTFLCWQDYTLPDNQSVTFANEWWLGDVRTLAEKAEYGPKALIRDDGVVPPSGAENCELRRWLKNHPKTVSDDVSAPDGASRKGRKRPQMGVIPVKSHTRENVQDWLVGPPGLEPGTKRL